PTPCALRARAGMELYLCPDLNRPAKTVCDLEMKLLRALYVINLFVLTLSDANSHSLDTFLESLPASILSIANVISRDEPENDVQAAWAPSDLPALASDALWYKSVSKGNTLLEATSYNDVDAGKTFKSQRSFARSLWDLSLLSPWGWRINPANIAEFCDFEPGPNGHWGMGPFLRSKGFSSKCTSEGGAWIVSQVFHGNYNQKYEPMTAAEFIMGVNGKDVGCITFSRHGCDVRAADLPPPPVPPGDFPSLRQSSDLLWALWEKDTPRNQQGNINFFLTLSIENTATLQILRRSLEQNKRELMQTPVVFDMSSLCTRLYFSELGLCWGGRWREVYTGMGRMEEQERKEELG
ncbi:hypothetical protein J1614_009465, partial [Plenodomus biglobosus]